MTDLTGRAIKNTYKDLIQVSNSNAGVDTTLRSMEDGEGTATLIKVSTTATQVGAATLVDSSENEVIKTAGVSSAVNEVTFTNAATGTSPIIEATGGDSVVGLDLKTKGGGIVRVNSVNVLLVGDAVVGETVTTLNALMRWGNTTGTSAKSSGWTLDSVDTMTASGALAMGGNNISNAGAVTATSFSSTSQGALPNLDDVNYAVFRAAAMS